MKNITLYALGIAFIYVIMASLKLHYPGVQADEALFVRAAMRGMQGAIKSIHGIPIHLIAYIGAFKSWAYNPIFKLFGVSTESIRFPMILLTGGSLFLLFLTCKRILGEVSALIIILVLAFDTSLFVLTRSDIGPSAIDFFLKIAVLFCFVHFIEKKNLLWWLPIPVFLFFGVFNKLNFIWFFNSFSGSVILIYGRHLFNYFKTNSVVEKLLFVSSIFLGWGFTLFYFGWMMIHYKIFGVKGDVHYFSSEWERIYVLTKSIITGEGVQYIYGDSVSILMKSIFPILSIGIGIGVLQNFRYGIQKKSFFFFFCLLNLLFLLIQQYFTKEAYNPWHAFTIQPFFLLCGVMGWIRFFQLFRTKIQTLAGVILLLLYVGVRIEWFLVFTSHHGKPNLPYIENRQTDIVFSGNAFYDLIEYAKTTDKKMILFGWAMYRQLGIYTNQPARFIPAEELFHSPPAYIRNDSLFYERYLKNSENNLFVAEGEPFKYKLGLNLTPIFLKILENKNLKPVVVKEITDGKDLIFQIYRVEKFKNQNSPPSKSAGK